MPQLHFREIDSGGVRIRLNILPFKQMLGDSEVVGSQIPLVEDANKMISQPQHYRNASCISCYSLIPYATGH